MSADVNGSSYEAGPNDAPRGRSGSTPSGKAGEIAAELERRLMVGSYRFGESLSITQLANQFDASRQPVSMAISYLRNMGYVDVIPQVGCRVVSPSTAEIADFFFAMGKIEGAVASFAAARYSGGEAVALQAIAARQPPKALETVAERLTYIRTLNDFHEQIWRMARSPTLENRVGGLRQLSIFYLWQGARTLAPIAAQQLVGERVAIAAAIGARAAARAQTLMESHIANKPRVSGVVP